MMIKLCQGNRGHYIDILCVSDPSQHFLIRAMIAKLAVWGGEQAYFYIRYLTMNLQLATYLEEQLKPNVSHPRFAFYAKEEALLNKLKTIQWPWELIDSDWEHFNEI